MITLHDLNPHGYKTNPNIDKNLETLLMRINELERAYGKPFVITSGLRSEEKQAELRAEGKTNAIHSYHCAGAAVDIYDPDKELQAYCIANVAILERIGFWCEDFKYTVNWCHFQCLGPRSQKRFFQP
jgi:uncharacterized protein YcbK (DUF882 family)